MKIRPAILALTALLTCGPAAADSQISVAPLLKSNETVLGQKLGYRTDAPLEVRSTIVTVAPGAALAEHRHPVPIFAYVLEGAITVRYENGEERIYKEGEAVLEAVNTWHAGRNDGAVPVRILVVGMGVEGVPDSVAK